MTLTREAPVADGRHKRAQASREAIVDALVGLYSDGHCEPSAAEIAARAGLSERSLFRHFDDIDDLCHTAFVTQWHRLAEKTSPHIPLTLATSEKVRSLVSHRVGLYVQMMNVMRIVRMHAVKNEVVAKHVRSSRREMRRQHRTLFSPEVGLLDERDATAALMVIDSVLSFENVEQLRGDLGMSVQKIEELLVDSLVHVFELTTH